MTEQLITAFLLGLVGGIVPGPVLAATFTEILQSGLYKSFRIILIAMLTETLIALMSMVLLMSFGLPYTFFNILSCIGAGILIWIAFQLWTIRSLDIDEKVHFSAGKIAVMILTNGVLWTFWITVCVPKAVVLGGQIVYGQYLFLILVEIGWLISTIGVALTFSLFRSTLSNPKVIPYTFRFFALVFVYFALTMIYTSTLYFFF